MLATLVTSFLIVFSYIESLVLIIDLQFALEFNNMTE